MRFLHCLVLACALALAAPVTRAQLRTIPPEARPASLRHVQDMIVDLDGKLVRLSPGAQIRDAFNRLVLPTALAEKTSVRYVTDASGMVHRVWILSPEEVARLPKPEPKKDEKAK